MAILLLLLILFAALAVFVMLVTGLMMLFALGTTYSLALLLVLFVVFSLLGGGALHFIAPKLQAPQWSLPVASSWMALAIAVEFAISIGLWRLGV